MGLLFKRRYAYLATMAWWLAKRRLTAKFAAPAPEAVEPRKRHRLRKLVLLVITVAGSLAVWRRFRPRGDDGWTAYQPAAHEHDAAGNGGAATSSPATPAESPADPS